MSMAVGMQDSGDVSVEVVREAFWDGFREKCQAGGVGALGSELCQEDLPPHKLFPCHFHHELERSHVSKST